MGRIPIDLIKSLYKFKLNPDIYILFNQEEDIIKNFFILWNLYNARYYYITCDKFVEYYSGLSDSVIHDNYDNIILNGVWNSNNQENKKIYSKIEEN